MAKIYDEKMIKNIYSLLPTSWRRYVIEFFCQKSQFFVILQLLIVKLRNALETIKSSEPCTSDSSSGIVVSTVENSSEAKFLP